MNLLSRYTLLERLGNSVLGTTYKAQDKATGSFVTLRLLYLGLLDDVSRQELEARLQRDFEAADRLQHPGIARVFEMRREGHTALIASELIDGPTVTSFARASGGSELSQVVTAVGQLLDALDFAHRQGVLHRDLRPANVRVQGERLKIADFGMADLGGSGDDGSHRDRTEYMAPEQFGSGGIDARCDIHASGVILYELLTGRSPFAGEADGLTAMFRVLNFVPLPPSQVRPGLAPAFDRVLQRALAKAPGERFATAQQFRDELRSAYSTLMRRPPPDTLVRSVFASQVPPAPAARTADSSLTSPLPEELFVDKARAAVPAAPARAAPERAPPTPARAAPSAPPEAPVPGNTMPGGKPAAGGAATPREVTSRSLRPDTPAVPAPKGNGHADALKSLETPAPAPSSRDTEKGARGTPAGQSENKKFVPERAPAPSAAPAAAAPAESARAKEPEKAAPPLGGTVLTPPKRIPESARPAASPEPAPPAKDSKKDAPAAGGTVLTPPKRPVSASEPEKAKPVVGGTVLSPARPAAASSVADDLIGDAVPVESVLADEPKPPESARAAPSAKAAAPPAPGSEPAAEDELSETQQAKQFGRTVWIPTPKDDSGLYRPPKVEPPPAPPAESVASTPPPKAPPPPKKVVPLTDAAVTHGGKVLARFMGPIAMVLSRRAAQDYKDEKAFFDALASHLSDPDERYKFLREVRQRPA